MIQLIKHYTIYNQAQTWLEAAKTREVKKQVTQMDVQSEVALSMDYAVTGIKAQTIFQRVDTGHNREEASKIQQLYQELKDLPLSSLLAAG